MAEQPIEERPQEPVGDRREPPTVDLRALVLEHHATAFRYAFRLTGNAADAEDLVQQTYLIAQQHLAQLRDPQKARAWLLAILRNCYHRSHRRTRPVAVSSLDFDLEDVPEEMNDSPIDGQRLQLALEELPEEFRIVVLMFYFEECSYKEIASQLEIPIGTVMSRLARAKGYLRRQLHEAEVRERPAPAPPGAHRGLPPGPPRMSHESHAPDKV
jgi:RNA polymerase sigma-70 factor (ECF subfamily)